MICYFLLSQYIYIYNFEKSTFQDLLEIEIVDSDIRQ